MARNRTNYSLFIFKPEINMEKEQTIYRISEIRVGEISKSKNKNKHQIFYSTVTLFAKLRG